MTILPTPSRARIKDVAALAGVSPATASRALSNDPAVTEITKKRVIDAARTLRFRPNSLARDLRSGGVTTAIGYVMQDLANPWYAQVAAGAEEIFRKAGLELIVATTEEDPLREELVVRTMLERSVQALLLIPLSDDHSYLEGERQLGTPLIFVDRPPINLTADSITIDNRGGVAEGVDHLVNSGHRRIGLLSGPESLWTTRERFEGYKLGLKRNDIEFDPTLVKHSQYTNESVDELFSTLMSSNNRPSALISTNNRLTVSLLQTNSEMLETIAFLGFDDFELADLLKISVISYDAVELGRQAARLTLERIQRPLETPKQIEIKTVLVPRGSAERNPKNV